MQTKQAGYKQILSDITGTPPEWIGVNATLATSQQRRRLTAVTPTL